MADKEFQFRLRYARKAKRMTQNELAKSAGLKTKVAICKYENGINEPPIATLRRLSLSLGVSTDWLLGMERLSLLREIQTRATGEEEEDKA